MTDVSRPAQSGRGLALLVVHGIGNPAPGETVNGLADAWSAHGDEFEATATQEVVPLPDYRGDDSDELRTFPCHVRRGRWRDHPVVLAEVWWGSRSRARDFLPEGVRALVELVGLVVGLGTVGEAARDPQASGSVRRASTLARLVALVLTGPVLALNLTLLGCTLGHVLVETWFDRPAGELGRRIVMSTITAGLAGVAIWRSRARGGRARRPMWLSLAVIGVAGLLWIPFFNPGWTRLGVVQVEALALTFAGAACLQIAVALNWLVGWWRDGKEIGSRQLLAIVPTIQYAAWCLVIPLAWSVLARGLPEQTHRETTHFLDLAVRYDWLPWTLLGVVAAVLAYEFVVGLKQPRSSRLIVSRPAALLGTALTAIGSGMSLFAIADRWLVSGPGVVDTTTGGAWRLYLAAVALAAAPFVRVGIHLAEDVLSYLRKYTAANSLDRHRPIRSRFRRVVEHLHAHEQFEAVVVVAHSQGTVIAIDELAVPSDGERGVGVFRQPIAASAREAYDAVFRDRPTTLVTMGSPFSHLYQYYFPQHYPRGKDKAWDALRDRVDLWVNLFRAHDYVGQDVQQLLPEDHQINISIGKGGHVGYWTSAKVLRQIERALAATV